MLDFLSLDMAIGIIGASFVWAVGQYVYAKVKSGSSLTSAIAGLSGAATADAAAVESKLQAVVKGTASAFQTVRAETQVKLNAVESALHDRLVQVETAVFGPNYSAATQAAATPPNAAQPAPGAQPQKSAQASQAPANPPATMPAAPPAPHKVPASHVAAHKVPASHVAAPVHKSPTDRKSVV